MSAGRPFPTESATGQATPSFSSNGGPNETASREHTRQDLQVGNEYYKALLTQFGDSETVHLNDDRLAFIRLSQEDGSTTAQTFYSSFFEELQASQHSSPEIKRAALFLLLKDFVQKNSATGEDFCTGSSQYSSAPDVYRFLSDRLQAHDVNTVVGLHVTGLLKAYKPQFDQIANTYDNNGAYAEQIQWLEPFFSGDQNVRQQKSEIVKALANEGLFNTEQISRLFTLALIHHNPEIAEIALDAGALPSAINISGPDSDKNAPFFCVPTRDHLDAVMAQIERNREAWNPSVVEKIRHKGTFGLEMIANKAKLPGPELKEKYNKAILDYPYLKSLQLSLLCSN